MAFLKLGSKPEAFHREGQSWQCTSGLPSDITVEIEELSFHLHKFPLMSRSGLLETRIGELSSEDVSEDVLELSEIPGGAKAFELIAKFCYGVKMELSALNVVGLRCAAEYLQMTEDFGEGNLISQTETFLNEVFGNWGDTVKALKASEEVLSPAEEIHIVSRSINSLATKACADPNLFNWPVSGSSTMQNPAGTQLNSSTSTKKPPPVGDDWWYDDVSFLSFPLYKRLIQAVESGGMKPERVSGSIVFYAKRHIPLINKKTSLQDAEQVGSTSANEAEEKALLEDIVDLLPNQKGVTPTKFLFSLLRAAMMLHASPSCTENLEKRVGVQLEQASLDDLLIPNLGDSGETTYDIDCIQRIVDHFMETDQAEDSSPSIVEEGDEMDEAPSSLMSTTMVANLVDAFLADVALDVNLQLAKFQTLAAAIPDYARPIADGIYRAIDIYLKAHPWLTDSEREQICRLMNCQKLSLEASTHAAQNERLPLRLIVQVLYFEQLRLRTSISGWLFVSDNLDSSQNPNANRALMGFDKAGGGDDVKERITDLEKECETIRQEIRKLGSKRSWNFFWKKKPQKTTESKASTAKEPIPVSTKDNQKPGKLV